MNILVIGSGGREHALAWAIAKSPATQKIYIAPGNGGTGDIAENVLINITDHDAVIDFCKVNNVKLVVVGPEAPLVDGIADSLERAGIMTFGPSKLAAQLEGSKKFTKDICKKYNIPTAAYESFTDANDAKAYIEQQSFPIVIKADGLAAGKGVVIAQDKVEALATIDEMLVDQKFGNASSTIVIEDFLEGEEISFFALVDETNAIPFGSAQDHKAVGEGDTGPNTGGMGTYTPAPIMNDDLERQIMEEIVLPMIHGMNDEGCPYRGVLFVGLMITKKGPELLEINIRFGDPETQSLMARLDCDIVPLLIATARGDLLGSEVTLKDQTALCVVLAAKGYPGDYEKGSIINGTELVDTTNNLIFHAGTKRDAEGNLLANGGRVLNIIGLGNTVTEAQERAYQAVDVIEWPEGFCRRDIGWRAVAREKEGKLAS